MTASSYRTILRSSSIMGAAQLINIITGLLKMKIVAVLLGPAGVGLVGLYQNLMQTASTVASLGLGSAGVRQIAAVQANGDVLATRRTSDALFWGSAILALIGAGSFVLISDAIAHWILRDTSKGSDVAWLSVGVAVSVLAGYQAALLTGLRRIGDIARVNILSGMLGALTSVMVLWLWGVQALVAAVILGPLASFVIGVFYTRRLDIWRAPVNYGLRAIAPEWHAMVKLGTAFMLSGLVTMLGFLAARTVVQRELGLDALGHFQAAWAIGTTYLGFVLGAMSTDYYPRLSAAIQDPTAACRLVNEQTEVALLLCAPVLLAMLGLSPWVIHLLYTEEFGPAVDVLRWQLLGDILKVISWPLGYTILALGAGRTFILTETLGMSVYVLAVLFLVPSMGVVATGMAFFALYITYLPIVWWFGGRKIRFHWTQAVGVQASVILFFAIGVVLLANWKEIWGAYLGVMLATISGLWAYVRLRMLNDVSGLISTVVYYRKRIKR